RASEARVAPLPVNRSWVPLGGGLAGTPKARVSEACGSRSTSSTRWPACASPRARHRVVVVLPTPPFWLAIAQTCISARSCIESGGRGHRRGDVGRCACAVAGHGRGDIDRVEVRGQRDLGGFLGHR